MMVKASVFIATSLDGYIAREDGSLDWLPGPSDSGDDCGYCDYMDEVDGLIMGKNTYETVLGFGSWPYKKPVIVLSRSLNPNDVPKELKESVRIFSYSPKVVMDLVEKEGWKKAYIDGGEVIQSFLANGLIDEMIITVIPKLIGGGRSLFGSCQKDISLDLVSSSSYAGGFVQNRYLLLD